MDRLNRHFALIFKEPIEITPADCTYIFVKFRQVIEAEKVGERFPQIRFFANWILHTELERNLDAKYSALEAIFLDVRERGERDSVNDRINDLLSFAALRKELIEFANRFKLNTDLFKSREVWYQFVDLILPELVDKPLKFHIAGRKVKKKETGLGSSQRLGDLLSLRLVGVHEKPLIWQVQELLNDGSICVHSGTVARTESESAFDAPKFEIIYRRKSID